MVVFFSASWGLLTQSACVSQHEEEDAFLLSLPCVSKPVIGHWKELLKMPLDSNTAKCRQKKTCCYFCLKIGSLVKVVDISGTLSEKPRLKKKKKELEFSSNIFEVVEEDWTFKVEKG